MIWKALLAFVSVTLMGCSPELGSKANPLKITSTRTKGQELATGLTATTGLHFTATTADDYMDQVVAIGEKKADLAFMNNMTYLLANEQYGARAIFAVERGQGDREYKGMIITHKDSQTTKIEELDGKHIAYVEVHSLSGYIMPAMLLKSQNISPTKITRAGSHANVVRMVYERQADAGFTYFEEADKDGTPRDARTQLTKDLPDVLNNVIVVTTTDVIPNEPIVIGRDVDDDVREIIMSAMEELIQTEDGEKIFDDLNQISGLRRVSDSEYDPIRQALQGLGKRLDEVVPGGGILKLKRLEAAEPIPPLGN
ncbi:MAG: phosphate/phosphite/phosphonate ABC transporter substrate-binding protein [Proteobacteria bacterium]|nr:phosphate/phosphite/phosphonate ABC transporter substrate-binding protein [Pseudomonadota bacterium]